MARGMNRQITKQIKRRANKTDPPTDDPTADVLNPRAAPTTGIRGLDPAMITVQKMMPTRSSRRKAKSLTWPTSASDKEASPGPAAGTWFPSLPSSIAWERSSWIWIAAHKEVKPSKPKDTKTSSSSTADTSFLWLSESLIWRRPVLTVNAPVAAPADAFADSASNAPVATPVNISVNNFQPPDSKDIEPLSGSVPTSAPHARRFLGWSCSASKKEVQPFGPADKRDTVISSTLESTKPGYKSKAMPALRTRRDLKPDDWWPSHWWPCRTFQWIFDFIAAFGRVRWDAQNFRDLILTVGFFVVILSVALELLLKMIPVVAAQDLDANCSVVYVTVPGPIITVSLVGASPTNPARGTYYFSVINGTTAWLDSIAPPSRFSTLFTRTPDITPVISSLPATGSFLSGAPTMPLSGLSSASALPLPGPSTPGVGATFTTTVLYGSTLITTVITSAPGSNGSMLSVSTLPLGSPSSDLGTISSVLLTTSSTLLTPGLPTVPSSTGASTLSAIPGLPGNLSSAAALSSSSITGALPVVSPSLPLAPGSGTISSVLITITSIMPGGSTTMLTSTLSGIPTTMLTSTSTTALSGEPSAVPSGSATTTALGIPIMLTSTIPGGSLTMTISTSSTNVLGGVPPESTSGAGLPSISSVFTTLISTLPGGSITTELPSPSGVSSSPAIPTISSVLMTATTTDSNGQPTTVISTALTTIVPSFIAPSLSSLTGSPMFSPSFSAPTSGGSTISLPNPTAGSGTPSVSSVSTAVTMTLTRSDSGLTTTITLVSSMLVPISGSLPSSTPSLAASSSLPTISNGVLPSLSSLLTSSSGSPPAIPSSTMGSSLISSSANSSSSLPVPSVSLSSTISLLNSSIEAPTGLLTSLGFTPSSAIFSITPTSSPSILPSSTGLLSLASTFSGSLSLPTSVLSSSNTVANSSATSSTTLTSGLLPTMMSSLSLNPILSSTPSSSSSSALPSSVLSLNPSIVFSTITPSANGSLSPSIGLPTSSLSTVSSSSTTASSIPVTSPSAALNSSLPISPSSFITGSLFSSSVTVLSSSVILSASLGNVTAPSISSSLSTLISTETIITTTPAITSFALVTPTSLGNSNSSSVGVSSGTLTSTLTLTIAPPLLTPSSPSGSNDTSFFMIRAMTKVISYGDTAVSFVFPSPNITTTVSYWTGEDSTVTGPLPSDLQTIALTTRTSRQTPLSALPSFQSFSSRSRRFRTVVTTIYEDGDETTAPVAKRQDVPVTVTEPTQILATATVEIPDAPEPSSCGESGNFTLNFDDTVVGNDDNILFVANGMTNPYHHLFYANGYTYVPDKWEPFPAISQPNVAMFLPLTGRLLPNTPFAGTLLPGELGAGPRASVDAYWFNAYSAYFGCALSGLTPCTLRISGYRYDSVLKEEVLVAEQNATLPACWGYINCRLTQVFFNEQFQALSGIQFNAYTYNLNIPQVHMMDDLQLEWYNNTCAAGILRIGNR